MRTLQSRLNKEHRVNRLCTNQVFAREILIVHAYFEDMSFSAVSHP